MSSDINELPKAKEKRCKNSEQISNATSVQVPDLHFGLAPNTADPATTV
jgi:hypothetical protein